MMKIDQALQDRVAVGFEMLYNNFSAGILAPFWRSLAATSWVPIMGGIASALGNIVDAINDADCYHWRIYPSKSERCCSLTTPSTTASWHRLA